MKEISFSHLKGYYIRYYKSIKKKFKNLDFVDDKKKIKVVRMMVPKLKAV